MLHAALQRICDELAAVVSVRQAIVHRGLFDAKELARASIQAPGLLLHCAALDPLAKHPPGLPARDYDATLTLYVIARDHAAGDRLERMLDDLIAPLLGAIPLRWWHPATRLADGIGEWHNPAPAPRAQSLYSTTIDQHALALWALEWEQRIRLPIARAA